MLIKEFLQCQENICGICLIVFQNISQISTMACWPINKKPRKKGTYHRQVQMYVTVKSKYEFHSDIPDSWTLQLCVTLAMQRTHTGAPQHPNKLYAPHQTMVQLISPIALQNAPQTVVGSEVHSTQEPGAPEHHHRSMSFAKWPRQPPNQGVSYTKQSVHTLLASSNCLFCTSPHLVIHHGALWWSYIHLWCHWTERIYKGYPDIWISWVMKMGSKQSSCMSM